jgi:hypothetical protein
MEDREQYVTDGGRFGIGSVEVLLSLPVKRSREHRQVRSCDREVVTHPQTIAEITLLSC